ncbi:hypothetical protein [Mycolicibacterium sp. CBMA 361]|uniref:hypothetical protein n=1 Tax=Mycolicibacterium sp. CBMA 361 TaxID=2606610 RepID=UPI001EF10587|nr:hypothetical protein [Mycolicibacterium sp. CBMA 361]
MTPITQRVSTFSMLHSSEQPRDVLRHPPVNVGCIIDNMAIANAMSMPRLKTIIAPTSNQRFIWRRIRVNFEW